MALRTREQIKAMLDQCGNLDYGEMIDLLDSILFYYESGGSGGIPPKFYGLWNNQDATDNKYDIDTYVSYGEKIYRSLADNNQSIPGTDANWIVQNDVVIPDDIEFEIGDGQTGTPAQGTLTVQFPALAGRRIRIFRDGARKGTKWYAAGDGFTQPTAQGLVNVRPAWQPNERVIIEIFK